MASTMTAASSLVEADARVSVAEVARIEMDDVSWETYARLVEDRGERRKPRLAFDQGWLQIVSPTAQHDEDAHLLGLVIEFVAAELRVGVKGMLSTTYTREDLQAGFEGDHAFYIQREAEMRGVNRIVPGVHPVPDIVIESDVSRSSERKLTLLARFGVPEVWRVVNGRVLVFVLTDGRYESRDVSAAIPALSVDTLNHLLSSGRQSFRPDWVDEIRAWVRGLTSPTGS